MTCRHFCHVVALHTNYNECSTTRVTFYTLTVIDWLTDGQETDVRVHNQSLHGRLSSLGAVIQTVATPTYQSKRKELKPPSSVDNNKLLSSSASYPI